MKHVCLVVFLSIVCVLSGIALHSDTGYQLYLTQIAAAEALLQLNKISEARSYLNACDETYRDLEWHFLDAHLDQSKNTIVLSQDVYYTAIAMHPAGDLFAVSCSDHSVVLYSYPELEKKMEFKGHTGSVSTIAFSNDGNKLASGGRDHTVIIWDVKTGKELCRNSGAFKQGIYQVRFSPDDAILGAVSWERTTGGVQGFAKLLNTSSAAENKRMNTDDHPAAGIVFPSDHTRLIVSTWGEIVYAFDINTGEAKWKYDLSDYDEYNAFHSIAISQDGSTVVVGSTDHRLHFLHASDGRLIRRIEPWEGHTKTIKALSFSRDGRFLSSAGEDQTIHVWDVQNNEKHLSLIGHTGTVTGLAWSSDGSALISTSTDGTMKQWDLSEPFVTQRTICDFGPWQTPVSSDKKSYAAPCSDQNLATYEITTCKEQINFGHQNAICADFSGDGSHLVTAGFDGIVRLWDVQSGKEIRTMKGHSSRVDGVAYLDSQRSIISVGDTTLRIWSIVDSLTKVIPLEHGAFRVVVHPDETKAYAGSGGGYITVYNTDDWEAIQTIQCANGLQEMTISDDRKMFAVYSGKDIEIWDLQTLTQKLTLKGHLSSGYGIGFSPDGRYLISGSNDQTFKLWNLETGACTLTYHGYDDTVYSCKFITARTLLIGTSQGVMRYYRF